MNEPVPPKHLLDRYHEASPPALNEQELAAVRKHLAESCLEAVFGALPFQANTGLVSKEIRSAQERIAGTTPGPYIIGDQYEPDGRMLYMRQTTPQA